MKAETFQSLVNRAFEGALEISAESREAYVRGLLREHPEAMEETLSLLASHAASLDFLQNPTHGAVLNSKGWVKQRGFPSLIGEKLGPYRILEELGEGTFARVYLAEQRVPLARRVAIKVLRPSVRSEQVLARFATERQVLARLDHPAIVRILDAAETSEEFGCLPYFVMEVVIGSTITTYCQTQSLSIEDRIRLFLEVCRGVEYAHQNGLIHRDIKPENILVSEQSGQGRPKIIDFGIAKATLGLPDAAKTAFLQFVGTPGYMSPEQASLEDDAIDTRADVYSLGAVLYQLLTDRSPFDTRALRAIGVLGLRSYMEANAPLPPSAVNARKLPRDLDWIVAKAMAPARERRFQSVTELATDLERFLSGLPVVAAPPSVAYQVTKFALRHKLLCFGVLAVIASACVAVTAVVAGWIDARRSAIRIDTLRQQELLSSIGHMISRGDGPEAARLLESVPLARRGWEWQLLRSQFSVPKASFQVDFEVSWVFHTRHPRWCMVGDANDPGRRVIVDWRTGKVVKDCRSVRITAKHDLGGYLSLTQAGALEYWSTLADAPSWSLPGLFPSTELQAGMSSLAHPFGAEWAFSPDGDRFVIRVKWPERDQIQVRSSRDGALLWNADVHAGWDGDPAFLLSPGGDLIVVANRAYEAATGSVYRGEWYPPASVQDHDLYLSLATEARCRVIAAEHRINRVVRPPSNALLHQFALYADGETGIGLDTRQQVGWWDLTGRQLLRVDSPLILSAPVRSLTVSPDLGQLFLLKEDGRTVDVHGLQGSFGRYASLPDVRTSGVVSTRTGLAFSGGYSDVLAIDTLSLLPVWRKQLQGGVVSSLSLTPDSNQVVATIRRQADAELMVMESGSGDIIWERRQTETQTLMPAKLDQQGLWRFAAPLADEKTVVAAADDGSLMWLASDFPGLAAVMRTDCAVKGLSLAPSGNVLAVFGSDPTVEHAGVVVLLDPHARQVTGTIPTPAAVSSLSWSADGRYIVTTSGGDTVTKLDVRDGVPVWNAKLSTVGASPRTAVVRGTGNVLIASDNGEVHVLDGFTGVRLTGIRRNIRTPLSIGENTTWGLISIVSDSNPVDVIEVRDDPARRVRHVNLEIWRWAQSWPYILQQLPFDRFWTIASRTIEGMSFPKESIELIQGTGMHSKRWANSEVIRIVMGHATPEELTSAADVAARNAAMTPGSPLFETVLSLALERSGRSSDALRLVQRSDERALGVDVPLADLVAARCLISLCRDDEAHAAMQVFLEQADQMEIQDPITRQLLLEVASLLNDVPTDRP